MPAGEVFSPTFLRSLPEAGEPAAKRLFEALYDELHRLARRVREGRAGETMSTTALVHEAYMKLASPQGADPESRMHFYRIAARAMRQILIDAARRHVAEKRGGGDLFPVTFDEALHAAPMAPETFLALDHAIDRLARVDARAAQVVECRYFAGLSVEETATALDISTRTVKRDWRIARARLAADMAAADA
jgi:RNA polymerase sigma factor (TIGR02999 family)